MCRQKYMAKVNNSSCGYIYAMRPRYHARRFITKFTKISKIKFNEPIYFLLVHIPTHILYALLSDYVIHHIAGAHLRAKTRNERKKRKKITLPKNSALLKIFQETARATHLGRRRKCINYKTKM